MEEKEAAKIMPGGLPDKLSLSPEDEIHIFLSVGLSIIMKNNHKIKRISATGIEFGIIFIQLETNALDNPKNRLDSLYIIAFCYATNTR